MFLVITFNLLSFSPNHLFQCGRVDAFLVWVHLILLWCHINATSPLCVFLRSC